MALILASKKCELREILLKNKPDEMLEVSSKGTVPVLQFNNKVLMKV
jgi:glutathione S-transferase